MTISVIAAMLALGTVLAIASPVARAAAIDSAEARAIAAEAYVYAYAPLYNYKTWFQQTQDPSFSGYTGGFDRYRNYSRTFTPADTDIVTPNNDTPYSWAWMDLRAEPVVLSVPAFGDRYYVVQLVDLYTFNFAYIGMRATGNEAGDYLLAGPDWHGETPKGIKQVLRADTRFIMTLTRVASYGPADQDALQGLQRQLRLRPLSEYAGTKPPPPAPTLLFPAWDDARAASPDFISYLNFILQFCPPLPLETDTMSRFAKIGIGADRPFDSNALDGEMREAIAAGIADGKKRIDNGIASAKSSAGFFGTRESLGADYALKRAIGAAYGIYGNSLAEAYYVPYAADSEGKPLSGANRYEIHLTKEQIAPASIFWSMTMYTLPQRLLAANPINRYSIGDHTERLKTAADGSVMIYIQRGSPGEDKESNWLPSPAGNFFVVLRMYGPKGPLLDGTWKGPQPQLVN